jgi:multidrug efflux pump subunit AcrA (membrane-fusion protein)
VSRARAILVLVAVLAAAGGAAWHYSRTEAPASKKGQASPPVPVKLAKAVMRDMPLKLAITGRTEAYETVTLKSRVEGQVQAVTFTEGQHVRQGDVLLRLDPADFQAKLNQAEANLARSQAQTAKARADVERYIALREKGFVSEEKSAKCVPPPPLPKRQQRPMRRRPNWPACSTPTRSSGRPLPALSAQSWYSPAPRSRSMKRPWRW